MINAVIVDDEPRSVSALQAILKNYHPQVNVLSTANNITRGQEIIQALKPQLVFLDIEMPDGTGFDLLGKLAPIEFDVIFITAYDQYAVNAFRYASLDYLLKPVDMALLSEAIARAQVRVDEKQHAENYKLLLENLQKKRAEDQHISVTDGNAQQLVKINDIMYCTADGSYTWMHLASGKKYLSSRSMKEFEEMLPNHIFCRIHHGHIINVQYAEKLLRGRGGSVIMKDGTELEIAVRRKEAAMKMLKG